MARASKTAVPSPSIAYFSMEVGIDPSIPTYSGGLGILAGDTLRGAADLGIPMVGMTLLYRKGYFRQRLDAHGNQSESPYEWSPEKVLQPMKPRIAVTIEGRQVFIRAWRYLVRGISGYTVPVYFLDTALPENSAPDFSRYINGVAMRHGEISRGMYPNYPVNSITNGVHAVTWTAVPFQRLYDRYIPEWRNDNLYLRYAISIPLDEIRQAHAEAKRDLLAEVERRTDVRLDPTVMTLGFARRATTYKRADLLLSDMERLKRIVRQAGPLQIIYGGKAHQHWGMT